MHGGCIDWVVINTIKDALDYPSGEEHLGGPIRNYLKFDFESLSSQPIYEKVLDLGSLNINGTMRTYDFLHPNHPKWIDLIGCKEYYGIDLMEGPSVDEVMDSHKLEFEDNSFDMVMSLNVLEHDSNPLKTLMEASRVAKIGGTFILSCSNETTPDHRDLGGASTDMYNKITKETLLDWFKKTNFKIINFITTHSDHQVKCIKI
jgi:SAM-dependent methyltransferase